MAENIADIFEVLSGKKPIKIKLGNVKYFSRPECDVVYIEVHGEHVYDLHNRLRNLPHEPSEFRFTPHITIAKVKKGLGSFYALRFGNVDATCRCDTAVFSDDNQKHVYPLGRTITVEKAAMSYLHGECGGALVPPSAMAKKIKIRRNSKRRVNQILKDALGEEADCVDPEDFVFGKSDQPRETTFHDGKRPGEFAPVEADHEVVNLKNKLRQMHLERAAAIDADVAAARTRLERHFASGGKKNDPLVGIAEALIARMERHAQERRELADGKTPDVKWMEEPIPDPDLHVEKAVTAAGNIRGWKPNPKQASLWDEDSQPRETYSHDGKKPGEFAPKEQSPSVVSDKEDEPEKTEEKPQQPELNPAQKEVLANTDLDSRYATRYNTSEPATRDAGKSREGKKVTTPYSDVAEKHGRTIRGDGKSLFYRTFVGNGKREKIERMGIGREVGDVFHSKQTGGPMLIVSVDKPYFISDDEIEDNDAWSDYKDGPGWYASYKAIPVNEIASEVESREKKEAEEKTAAAAKKKSDEAWSEVADLPATHELPAGLPSDLKWEKVKEDLYGNHGHGSRWYIATLPDGTKIGHHSSSAYDDHRDYYYVPKELTDSPEAVSARQLQQAGYDSRDYGKSDDEKATARAEFNRLGAAHYAAFRTVPSGLTPEMEIRKREAWQHVMSYPEAVRTIIERHPDAKSTLHHYAASGEGAALAAFKDRATEVGDEAKSTRDTQYQLAHDEWHPKIAAEFGEEAADTVAKDVRSDVDAYSHIDDAHSRFEDAYEGLKKDAAEESAKAAKRAARKADPLVEVSGNTYPHRDALGKIPGSKLTKSGGKWVWKIPKSQASKLPRGLRV